MNSVVGGHEEKNVGLMNKGLNASRTVRLIGVASQPFPFSLSRNFPLKFSLGNKLSTCHLHKFPHHLSVGVA